MLLSPGLPPTDQRGRWALELKWDGVRPQLRNAGDGTWCLRSRRGRACSDQFPELAELADDLPGRAVLVDGELVCLDAEGRPDFHRLRRRLSATNAQAAARLAVAHPAMLVVFDLSHLDGRAFAPSLTPSGGTSSRTSCPTPTRPSTCPVRWTGSSTPCLP